MSVDIDAGELDKRITIQAPGDPVSDGQGGFTPAWEDYLTVWAKIRPMRAKQIEEYRSVNVHATHLIEVRGGVDIQENHRIVFGSRIFEDVTIENEKEEGVKKWVTCKERRD